MNQTKTINDNDSYVCVTPVGEGPDQRITSFVGRDAVNLFAAISLKSALGLYGKHKMQASRFHKPMVMLKAASGYTGQKYKKGDYLKAAEDMEKWIITMRAALPVVENSR